MNSLLLLALLGSVAPSASPSPLIWQSDYTQARELAQKQSKPLAVFVGTGPNAWTQLAQDGQLDARTLNVLAQDYVVLYADTTSPMGRTIASTLEVRDPNGLVISDASGKLQAFSHSGTLSAAELQKTVEKFADRNHKVVTTESLRPAMIDSGVVQASYQVPAANPAPIMQAPLMQAPAMAAPQMFTPQMVYPTRTYSGGVIRYGTSSCPNGNCPNAISSCPNGNCPR